jgi:hypothetical protein
MNDPERAVSPRGAGDRDHLAHRAEVMSVDLDCSNWAQAAATWVGSLLGGVPGPGRHATEGTRCPVVFLPIRSATPSDPVAVSHQL